MSFSSSVTLCSQFPTSNKVRPFLLPFFLTLILSLSLCSHRAVVNLTTWRKRGHWKANWGQQFNKVKAVCSCRLVKRLPGNFNARFCREDKSRPCIQPPSYLFLPGIFLGSKFSPTSSSSSSFGFIGYACIMRRQSPPINSPARRSRSLKKKWRVTHAR